MYIVSKLLPRGITETFCKFMIITASNLHLNNHHGILIIITSSSLPETMLVISSKLCWIVVQLAR